MVLSFRDEECLHIADNDVEQVIDTVASDHATSGKDFFTSYQVSDFSTVKMANTSYSKIVRIGYVCIRNSLG